MKKVWGAIGAVVVFFALSMVIIFFAETTTNVNFNLPGSNQNLTADISANNPQLADVNAVANDGTIQNVATSDAATTPPNTDVTVVDATATPVITAAVPAPVPAVGPEIAPSSVSETEALQPQTDPSPPTSTVATATIIVTPTVPAPPPSAPPAPLLSATQSSNADNIALLYNETNFAGDNNWQTTWGVMNTTWAGSLDFSAGSASIGGSLYLKNSENWANYTMNATLNWVGGKTIGLMANYKDASNYIICEYSKTGPGIISMQLMQYANGSETALSSADPVSWNGDASNLDFSIAVDGVYGTCSLNGQTVSNEGIGAGRSAMSSHAATGGAIGFAISDTTPDMSEIIVKQVQVAQK